MIQAVRNSGEFEYQARVIGSDGVIYHVASRGNASCDHSGKALALFGTLQDITEQVKSAEILETARKKAEQDAIHAHHLANTDVLTGFANRRNILDQLREHLDHAHQSGESLTIAIFDIDHFKSINDQYGHIIGDEMICGVAQCVSKYLRDSDHIGRIGGEEFMIILPNSKSEPGRNISERIRKAVEEESNSFTEAKGVTISIGIATDNPSIDSIKKPLAEAIDDLVQRADEALYQAKNSGRNILRVAA